MAGGRLLGDVLPFLAMVLVQIGYAGMNITSKLAMDSGMKPLVLVAYRQIFATFAMIPFAYFLERSVAGLVGERIYAGLYAEQAAQVACMAAACQTPLDNSTLMVEKTRPKITRGLLVQIFVCSLTGVTGNQVFYFIGLQNSTPTIGCALTNILPAVTFILAVIFRQESVGIKRIAGQAKVFGTTICVAGAMFLSFYHGHLINIGESSIHWKYLDSMETSGAGSKPNLILGSCFVMLSALSWAIWFIVQVKVSKSFPAPYTSTLLMCFMGSIQCSLIAVGANHKLSDWSLESPGRLIAALYAALICSALAFSLTSWSIQMKGALYVSVFSPLLLVVVAILSWALLHEKLYIGTAVGSFLIVGGLYAVLWGKEKEMEPVLPMEAIKPAGEKEDLELQMPANSNGINGDHVPKV